MRNLMFGEIFSRLLLYNSKVAVPDLGCFMSEVVESYLTHDGHILMPPSRRIFFRQTEKGNDGLLERELASTLGVTVEEARVEIASFVNSLQKELMRNRRFELDPVGTFRSTTGGQIFFVQSKALSNPEEFGLVPIAVSPIEEQEEQMVADSMPIADESVEENSATEHPQTEVAVADMVALNVLAAAEYAMPAKCATEEPVVAEEPIVAEPAMEGKSQKIEQTRKSMRGWWWLTIILVVAAIIMLILYIWDIPWRELWRNILYSKEQLEIMDNYNNLINR